MRLGAGIVIGACILAASAAMRPALPQSGDRVPFDAGYLEAAAFTDGSWVRQDAATESDQQAPPMFGMETEPVAGEVAEGAGRSGLARVGLINRAVDLAITPAGDEAQWGVADRRLALVRGTKMVGSIPKFVLDEEGTRRFVPSNRAGQGPGDGRSSPARIRRSA